MFLCANDDRSIFIFYRGAMSLAIYINAIFLPQKRQINMVGFRL